MELTYASAGEQGKGDPDRRQTECRPVAGTVRSSIEARGSGWLKPTQRPVWLAMTAGIQ